VLSHALGKDFFLDQYIFQASVILNKVVIVGDVSVQDFRRGSYSAVLLGIAIVLAKLDVGFLLTDGVLCHLQGVPHGDAIGEKVTALGLGDIAHCVVGGAIVKAGIVGDNCFDAVLVAKLFNMLASGVDADNLAEARGDLFLIHGALFSIVSSIEKLTISAEYVIDNEAESFVHVALAVMNTAAQVVHHRVVKAVGGLGVDGQIIILALVDGHNIYLIS